MSLARAVTRSYSIMSPHSYHTLRGTRRARSQPDFPGSHPDFVPGPNKAYAGSMEIRE